MRPIPAPRVPNAIPLPDGNSRDWVTHPGPEIEERFTAVPCHARHTRVCLPAGVNLLDAVAQAAEAQGSDGACAVLNGLTLSQMSYVMPDGPVDDAHAAWYSETHQAQNITLNHATASVGRKDGEWFLHTHAIWSDGTTYMGHLLNDQCIVASDTYIDLWILTGARLTVTLDPETNFPLFYPEECAAQLPSNATLLTIRPHEDLHETIEIAAHQSGLSNARILGLGSLIGAGFKDAHPMASQLSEVLLLDKCVLNNGRLAHLNLACVDPKGRLYVGDVERGRGPVLVTFELLFLEE